MLGIITTVKSYHFCWQINAALGYNFRLNPSIEIELRKKNRIYLFRVYQFAETNNALNHYIYHNHFDGEYLLPEFRHIDFLWLMKDDLIFDDYCNRLMQSIKNISGVQLITELNAGKIKNKSNLIF